MKTRKLAQILSLALALFLFTGCSGTPAGSQSSSGGGGSQQVDGEVQDNLNVGVQLDIDTLDPHNSTLTAAGMRLNGLIFETLITKNENSEYEPCLATEWEWLSDTELQFKLRQGVLFHDGTEMKASDVKFSIDRSAATARHSARYSDLEKIIVNDDYTVTFVTSQPSAKLMDMLSEVLMGGGIIPEAHTLAVGDSISTDAVGTGPYKVQNWAAGEELVVEQFEDYWGDPGVSKTITFRVISEDTSRVIALENGEIDIAETIPSTDITRIEDNPNLQLLSIDGMVTTYWGFNTSKAPFDDLRVRQALNYAIDRDSVAIAATNGEGGAEKSVLSKGMDGYYDGMTGFPYDPEQAKALLADAGYADGFTINIYVKSTDSNTQLAAQVLQSNLRDIGVTLNIESRESTALMDALAQGEHDTYILTASNPDVYNGLIFFYSQTPPRTGNRMFYNNPEFDALYENLLTELDSAKRIEILKEIQELLVEDCPWCPLYGQRFSIGALNGVSGVELSSMGFHNYAKAYVVK